MMNFRDQAFGGWMRKFQQPAPVSQKKKPVVTTGKGETSFGYQPV